MNKKSDERAFESIVAASLRRVDWEDAPDPTALPELNESEMSVLEALGIDFIERLKAGDTESFVDESSEIHVDDTEAVKRELAFSLDRSVEVDDELKVELERKEQELIERRKRQDEKNDSGA